MLADAMFEKIGASASRDQGGNQDIGIEENFQDTRVNTSSSV